MDTVASLHPLRNECDEYSNYGPAQSLLFLHGLGILDTQVGCNIEGEVR